MSLKERVMGFLTEALIATPGSATLTITLFGIPISQVAALLSIVVLLLQGYFLIKNGGRSAKRDP